MIKSLFDDTEEKNQDKVETVNQTEAQTEPASLPEDEDSLLDVPEFNYEPAATEKSDAPDAETSDVPDIKPSDEILPPNEIPILRDADSADETIEQPVLPVASGAKPMDELRLQSNTSNTRNAPIANETTIKNEPAFFQTHSKSESIAETSRKTGLAFSAAVTLFGSVVFLLIIGWFADLLFGSSPWGKVGGIVLGSIIGFIQFFRMTAQILKNND